MKIKTNILSRTRSCLGFNHTPTLSSASRSAFSFSSASASRRASVSAFTLIETVVATLFAAIMLPTLYAGLASGFAFVQASREDLRATQILLQRMEAFRLSSYNAVSAYPTNVTDYYSPSGQTNGGGGTAYTVSYNWTTGLSSLPPSYRSNVALVTVTASWKSGKVQRSRSMQSYVARYGIQNYVAGN